MGNLIRLLFWGLLLYIGYKMVRGFLGNKQQEKSSVIPKQGEETFRDPVCGTYISEDDAVIGRNGDERILFCSRECLEKYREQLEQQATLQQ